MNVRPQEEQAPEGAPAWVVTFGDMMSLLLTFFVLLLSFSTMEAQQFKMVAGYMREAFGLQTKEHYTGVPMGTTILSTDARQSTQASEEMDLVKAIKKEMQRAGMNKHGSVQVTERGVAVRLEGEVLFESGRSKLKQDLLPLIDHIAALAASASGDIEVEGHTDDVPISSAVYPSNWELSSARAGAAARYLIAQGVPPARIRAVGFADTRPVAPNDSMDNRAKNRRVEFLFVREEPGKALPLQAPAQLEPIDVPAAVAIEPGTIVKEFVENGGREREREQAGDSERREPAEEE